MQTLIAIDQVLNTLVNRGFADETLSARCFRMTDVSRGWNRAHKIVDWVFWHFFRDYNHCYNSYLSEMRRKHLPIEYRTSRLHAAFLMPEERE